MMAPQTRTITVSRSSVPRISITMSPAKENESRVDQSASIPGPPASTASDSQKDLARRSAEDIFQQVSINARQELRLILAGS